MYTQLDDCSTADAAQVGEYGKSRGCVKRSSSSRSLVRSYGGTNFRKIPFRLENLPRYSRLDRRKFSPREIYDERAREHSAFAEDFGKTGRADERREREGYCSRRKKKRMEQRRCLPSVGCFSFLSVAIVNKLLNNLRRFAPADRIAVKLFRLIYSLVLAI